MADEKDPGNEMEVLSKAIVDAIMKSRDVRAAMAKLSGADEIDARSFMVLMLKVGNLAEAMGLDVSGEKKSAPPKKKPAASKRTAKGKAKLPDCYEDGKRLSEAERSFREYLSNMFDQNDWLRKNGLIF